MKRDTATAIFETLSAGARLDIYRVLVKQGPEGMVAGGLAKTLKIAPNNLSFHLKALTNTGLLSVVQEGRFQRYRANMPLMVELIDYLTAECCANSKQCSEQDSCRDSRCGVEQNCGGKTVADSCCGAVAETKGRVPKKAKAEKPAAKQTKQNHRK